MGARTFFGDGSMRTVLAAWLAATLLLGIGAILLLRAPDAWGAVVEAPPSSSAGAVDAVSGAFAAPLALGGVGQAVFAPEQGRYAEAARLASPEAVQAREASQHEWSGLAPAAAAKLAGESFPGLIDRAAGGPPSLPTRERAAGFVSAHAERVASSAGGIGIVESLAPIAMKGSAGKWQPIELGLSTAHGGYQATRAPLPVRLPQDLSEGVSLPGADVSLTPLAANSTAAATAAQGTVDGSSVFWGASSVGPNVDLAARPTPGGVEMSAILRAAGAPEALRFRVGMPAGAKLVDRGAGLVQVVLEGAVLASIMPPSAVDAQDAPVPTAVSVAGDLLTIGVSQPAGRFAYPLAVDPQVTDEITAHWPQPTNWRWAIDGTKFGATGSGSETTSTIYGWETYVLGEAGMLVYPIREGSEARIASFSSEVTSNVEGHAAAVAMQMEGPSEAAHGEEYATNISKSGIGVWGVCWKPQGSECPTWEHGTPGNAARIALRATGTGSGATVDIERSLVNIEQEHGAEVKVNTTSPTVGGYTNALYRDTWIGPHSDSGFEIDAKDPGIGVSYVSLASGTWSRTFPILEDGECSGVQCNPNFAEVFGYATTMPEGHDSVEAMACDAGEEPAQCGQDWPINIWVDAKPPHSIKLSGLPANKEVGPGEYDLTAEATDGEGSTLSSGIKSLALEVDGKEVGVPSGSCSSGPCTAKSEPWKIRGDQYPVGKHTVTIVATDNANNVATESFTFTVVRAKSSLAAGPGTVNPESGEFTLTSTDVSMGAGLAVSRSYNSKHLGAGAEGPLGPQWAISMAGQAHLEVAPDGSVILSEASGAQTSFKLGGAGFEAPAGDSNVALSRREGEEGIEYVLSDPATGAKTIYTRPTVESPMWVPHKQEGIVETDTVSYAYGAVKVGSQTIVEPHEALAPVPAGVSCSLDLKAEPDPAAELKRGCRALTFNYAKASTATGEAPSEWGDHEGDLTRVYFTAWSNTAKAMKTVEVAHYLYDGQGRLRAEWDPRTEPTPESEECDKDATAKGCLAVVYGYDAEGHVTAVTPSGEQAWAFVYGTIPTDANAGRLLKVTRARPPAKSTVEEIREALAEQQTVEKNSQAPTIVGTPLVGKRLTISNGTWTPTPILYSYQWEVCNAEGGSCTPIVGATNASYAPASGDVGHTLRAQVTATDGNGSLLVATGSTAVIAAAYDEVAEYGSLALGVGDRRAGSGS